MISPTFNAQTEWTLEEKIRLLELFIDKDSGVWEDRANALQEEFRKKRPSDFFTQTSVKRELNGIFNKPNPEHHIFGLPMHPRGKEAAELWLKHFRKELDEWRARQRQLFMVTMRKQLDLIRRYQHGKLPKQELDALLVEARERDAQRPDKEQYEAKIKGHMAKAYVGDVKNVRTFTDYFRFLRGVRIPTPARSPSPVKALEEKPKTEIIANSFQGEPVGEKEQDEAVTSLCISLDKSKEFPPPIWESEARLNLRPLAEFESVELQTRVAKYAEANQNCLLAKSGPEEFKEHKISIRVVECIENGIPIIAKGRGKAFEAKDVKKAVVGQEESAGTSPKQQRLPRTLQVAAATPPTEKPKTRKRKLELSGDEAKDTDAESDKPTEKRSRRSGKNESDQSVSSTSFSSPVSSQPLISEVAAAAKLRSQLRRAAIASATPSPAVDSVADNRLFLKPGKLSSTEIIPKQILLTLWRDIHSHRHAPVFSFPVSEELVRGYHTAIKKSMDLKTLKLNIESGEVNTLGQVSHAILKMFANAVMYNSTGHYVNSYAKEMVAFALKCIEVVQLPSGQFHVPPPSRQSNGSSSEGGGGGTAAAAKFTWATLVPKNEKQRTEEVGGRHLFQRRPLHNKKYSFWTTI